MPFQNDLKYPIGKEEDQENYATNFNQQLKDQLLVEINRLPTNLEYAILNLDKQQLDTPYRPDGWTVQHLVHHVADSHINAYTRFKLALTEENPTIKPYNQDAWAALPDNTLPINISLTLLHALHSRWYEMMRQLPVESWERTIHHPERKADISLWTLLKSYAWHGQHHTAHILNLRKRMNWD